MWTRSQMQRPLRIYGEDDRNALKDGFNANIVVNACVRLLQSTVSQVPFAVQEMNNGTWENNPEHPLQLLLDKPNPHQTSANLKENIAGHLAIHGNSFITKIRGTGGVAEIWHFPPESMQVMLGESEYIKYYIHKKGNEETKIEADEIIHLLLPSPNFAYKGEGFIAAGLPTIKLQGLSEKWQADLLKNQAVVTSVIGVKEQQNEIQMKFLREQIGDFTYGGSKAGRTLIIPADLTYQSMSIKPSEMQTIEQQKLTIETLCRLMRTPPPLVGDYRYATQNNFDKAEQIYWNTVIIPMLTGICDILTLQLASEFSDTGKLRVVPDFSNVGALQKDMESMARVFQTLVQNGVKPRAAAKRLSLGINEDDIVEDFIYNYGAGVEDESTGESEKEPEQEATNDETKKLKHIRKMGSAMIEENQRLKYWKALDDSRQQWENALDEEIVQTFKGESKRVVQAFRDGGRDSALRAVTDERWRAVLRPAYVNALQAYGTLRYEEIGKLGGAKAQKAFQPLAEEIRIWLNLVITQKVTYMTGTTKSKLAAIIDETVQDGGNSDNVAKEILSMYSHWQGEDDSGIDEARAYTIARTEMGTVMNASHDFAAKQYANDFDVALGTEWVSSRDSRVRESHRIMDGQSVFLGEKFSNGLHFPCDPEGAAKETIKCRCVATHFVIDV